MSSASSSGASSFLKREQLIGKQVVGNNAVVIGNVKDLAMTSDGRVALHIEVKQGTADESKDLFIDTAEIQAIADVVLLKLSSTKPAVAPAVQPVAPAPPGVQTGAYIAPPPFPSGIAQGRICTRCNYSNSSNSRFCIKCGAPLQA